MKVVKPDWLNSTNLDPHEKFFVDTWFGKTNAYSLDTYRARCMNARTIVRELMEEIKIGLIKADEFKGICHEAIEILEQDQIIQMYFKEKAVQLCELLKKIVKDSKNKDKEYKNTSDFRKLRFLITDFSRGLEKEYFAKLCDQLQTEIQPGKETEIEHLTTSFISDLLDKEWSLSDLFSWSQHFLKNPKGYGFSNNINFMLRKFKLPRQSFTVVLRCSGSEKLKDLKSFGDFTILEKAPITPKTDIPQESRFAQDHQNVCFAIKDLEHIDYTPAAIAAKESLQHLLDLVRFEYEQREIEIDRYCYVTRKGDQKSRLCDIRVGVPNPVGSREETDFTEFSKKINDITGNQRIHSDAIARLQGALRQYRFGRDSENLKDKFLDWWMGLENLCYLGDGDGGIGPSVVKRTSNVISLRYFQKLIADLLETLKFVKIDWDSAFDTIAGGQKIEELEIEGLIALIQSDKKALLLDKCKKSPALHFYVQQIGAWANDPKIAAKQLETHICHLQWHIHRIYRIRCCIVHGSPVRHRLGMIVGNLEYYLKQIILFVADVFTNHDHILGLEEVFQRAEFVNKGVIEMLKKDGSDASTIKKAIVSDIVF